MKPIYLFVVVVAAVAAFVLYRKRTAVQTQTGAGGGQNYAASMSPPVAAINTATKAAVQSKVGSALSTIKGGTTGIVIPGTPTVTRSKGVMATNWLDEVRL